MNYPKLLKRLAPAGLCIFLWSCGGGGGSSSGSFNPSVRFINAVSDSTALNFMMNDTLAAQSLAYEASSPNFQTFSPGTYDIEIIENGGAQTIWAVTDPLAQNGDYVVVAIGEENFGTETLKRAQLVVVPVNRTAPNGSKAQLYFVNGFEETAGLPTPSVDFTNPGQNPTFSVTAVAPGNSASLLVDSGSQDFIVRQTGSQGNYVEKTLSLTSGGIYVVVVSGINGSTGTAAPQIQAIQLQNR